MAFQIEDEWGTIWYVAKNDPAYDSVQKLRKANYTWVVLPRETILSGKLPRVMSNIGLNNKKGFLRLMECVEVLSE